MLTNFFIDQGGDEFGGAVAIKCDDAQKRVLALVERIALEDYFGWPASLPDNRSPSLAERRLVVDRHFAEFQSLIQDLYARGEHESLNRFGSTITLVKIDQLSKAEIELTDSVVQMARASRFG